MICENQFGFRENRTTEQALRKVITQCFDNAKDKYHSCLIMLDIRKAFDTVNHELLLLKLYHYGIRGITYNLIQSHLNNRSQFVNIKNKFSKKLIIKHRVPQGSNLGPLLFLVYINDLPNALSCHTTLFVDDTCLLIQAKDVSTLQKRCNNELSKLQQWMNCNELTLNPNKTRVLLIPSSRQQVISTITLYLNNELIKPIETAKYLGITLDSQLKFDIYISKLLTKILRSIGVMSKIRHYLPKTVLINLYFALIHSRLLYGIAVWCSTYQTLINKLQVLQNKAMKMIEGHDWNSKVSDIYLKHKILTFRNLYLFEVGKLMYRFHNNRQPITFENYFTLISHSNKYKTRGITDVTYRLSLFTTNKLQHSIKFQGSNSLRNQKSTFLKFKQKLKAFLIFRK